MITPFETGFAMALRGEPAPDPQKTAYDWSTRLTRMGWESGFREKNRRSIRRIGRKESVIESIACISRLP